MRGAVRWAMLSLTVVALCAASVLVFWPDDESVTEFAPRFAGGSASPGDDPAKAAQATSRPVRPAPAIVHMTPPFPPKVSIPVAGDQFSAWVRDQDFVIGVKVGGEARCYAVNALHDPAHEVLNDTLGGKAIGVTWCSLCQAPVIFDRTLEGKTLTMFVSGGLAGKNMVIKDAETQSEWIQILGEAVSGPLQGKRLELIPALWTDWKTWRTKYPRTTVAAIPRRVQFYQHVDQYSDSSDERAYFDRFQWGLSVDDKARSWPFSRLAGHPIVNDSFGGRSLLVCFDRHTSSVAAFDRRVEGRELTFHVEGTSLVDEETGSTWDPITGRCTEGFLTEEQLQPAAGVVCTDQAWASFHPGSEIWSPTPEPSGTGGQGKGIGDSDRGTVIGVQ